MTPTLRYSLYHEALASTQVLSNYEFTSNLDGWYGTTGAGAWSWNTAMARVTLNGISSSQQLGQLCTFQRGGLHILKWNFYLRLVAGNVSTITARFRFMKNDTVKFTKDVNIPIGTLDVSISSQMDVRDDYCNRVDVQILCDVAPSSNTRIDMDFFDLRHGVEITEPGNGSDLKLILERSKVYHSLIESFEIANLWYGDALDLTRTIINTDGPDCLIRLFCDASMNVNQWEKIFTGTLGPDLIEAIILGGIEYKATIPIVPDDNWIRFFNRKSTPVDIRSATNLDGVTVPVLTPVTLKMTNQKINYYGDYEWLYSVRYQPEDYSFICQMDWEKVNRDDLNKFNLPRVGYSGYGGGDPGTGDAVFPLFVGNFEAPYDGIYEFNIKFETGTLLGDGSLGNPYEWVESGAIGKIGVLSELNANGITAAKTMTNFTVGHLPTTEQTRGHEFTGSFFVKKGDQVVVFVFKAGSDDVTIFGQEELSYSVLDLSTTAPVTLSGEQTIDGVLTSGSNVLVRFNGNPAENQAYTTAAGAWTPHAAPAHNKAYYITSGDAQSNQTYRFDANKDEWFWVENSGEYLHAYPGSYNTVNYLKVTGRTIFEDTEAEAFLLHDVFASVVDRITDPGLFYSTFLGSLVTKARTYASNGCSWGYALLKGLHVRGKTFVQKVFSQDFDNLYMDIDKILNVGFGRVVIDGVERYVLEKKEYFYADSDSSANMFNVENIKETYDKDWSFKKIKSGYTKGQSETTSGLNDPHYDHVYASRFQRRGIDLDLVAKDIITAPTCIEETRRKSLKQNQDWRNDNDTMMIAVVEESTDVYLPELNQNFPTVNNIENPETKYNLRLWPVWNLLRSWNILTGALDDFYGTSLITHTEGKGNYDASAIMDKDSDCLLDAEPLIDQGEPIAVNQVLKRTRNLHSDKMWSYTYGLKWEQYKAIKNNPTLCIGASPTSENLRAVFIQKLVYSFLVSSAEVKGWLKEGVALPETEETGIFDETFDETFE
jgi:hypothetical protein